MTPASAKIREWRENPIQFVREQFGTEPDAWQKEVLRAFASKDPKASRISMQACAGPGKTAAEAWCGWNFLSCYADKGYHPNAAAMAVTSDNLKDNLWKEMAVWMERSPFLKSAFVWTKERIFAKSYPATWFMSARSWSKSANAEEQGRTLSGLHSRYILYLIDESGDISPNVLRSAEQGLSNCEWGKILQAGNPTSMEGMLYAAATLLRHNWTVIRITGDPDDANRSPRISLAWAKEQIKQYGRDDPWVMAYILGQFPPSSINTLLGPDEVEAAMSRHLREDVYNWSQKRLGIDVARFGDDMTVIFPRQGKAAFRAVQMRHKRDSPVSVDIANRVMAAKGKWGSELEFFDDTVGWSHGAIDYMRNAGYSPNAILFNGKAPDPRYKNMRAYMWLKMAEWIRAGGALPRIPELVGELTIPTYTFMGGQFVMEEKDKIKERLKRSPNYADALGLTFAIPDMPASIILPAGVQNNNPHPNHASDYDPQDENRY